MPVCEMTTDVGGTYRWRWRNDEIDQEFGFTGEMLEVALHSKILHTQAFDPGNLGESMGGEPSIIDLMTGAGLRAVERDTVNNVHTQYPHGAGNYAIVSTRPAGARFR